MPKRPARTTASKQKHSPLILFTIGLSAGLCAALFPRLSALLLSSPDTDINLQFFSTGYVLIVLVFGVLIGLVMMWSYWGTRYTPQTLFMAALGIPSLLSGSLSMTNSVDQSTGVITTLIQERNALTDQLTQLSGIETLYTDTPIKLPTRPNEYRSWLDYLGFPTAVADNEPILLATDTAQSPLNYDPRAQINIAPAAKNYLVVISTSTNQTTLERRLKLYKNRGLTNLWIIHHEDYYYLVDGDPEIRSTALMRALQLKKTYGLQSIKLLQTQ